MSSTDRASELRYLDETIKIVRANLENYGGEVSRMKAEIDEMLEHYHDNDVEVWTILNNTITLHDHMKRALERNEKALQKPYFGRIIFQDETLGVEESLYIGKGGISRSRTSQAVVDWRAPVANAYYENGLGKCSYTAPDGKELPIDLKLKRTYEIEEGKLLDYFDTEVVANDDLLMKYLSKNKEAVLGEIVATIQKEQNEIIRKSPYHNCLVQGVAGSGKTTVAMHRISYILYNYRDRFRPEDFYIVGSNRILLNYITGVLPDLDVYGVRQMTMEQLFVRLLYEDWDDKKYRIGPVGGEKDSVKGTGQWFQALTQFIRKLEQKTIRRESVFLNPRQFVEGLQGGKNGIYDKTEEDRRAGIPPRLVELVSGEAVERYIAQNPAISIQSKINMLNDRLMIKVKDEFLGKGVKYTEEERKAILRAYRGWYGGSQWKKSIYQLYTEFLLEQRAGGLDVTVPENTFDVYDLAALALLYKLVKETEVISEAHHIVIDEAQDFGMMAYHVLHACIRDCTYTVMGDVSQNIHFGYGLGDWEELRALLLPDPMDSFGVLRKSYRNTVEISEFATKILRHGNFSVYPVEPIIRHGEEVSVEAFVPETQTAALGDASAPALQTAASENAPAPALQAAASENVSAPVLQAVVSENASVPVLQAAVSENAPAPAFQAAASENASVSAIQAEAFGDSFAARAAEICRAWQREGLDTIAVVCRNETAAKKAAEALARHVEIMESDLEKANFGSGIMVLPVEYTKGLEFDAVLLWNPTREDYPVDDGHAKLLYVAATRALHRLHVLFLDNLTGLIADPAPERARHALPGWEENASRPLASSSCDASRRGNPQNSGSPKDSTPVERERRSASAGSDNSSPKDAKGIRPNIPSGGGSAPASGVPQGSGLAAVERSGSKNTARTSVSRPAARNTVPASMNRPAAKGTTPVSVGQPASRNTVPVSVIRPAAKGTVPVSVGQSAARNTGTASVEQSAAKAPAFGDMPPTEKLRPAGHARINLAVRWVSKGDDGLYLQSQYGMLRISPVGSGIIRMTFGRGTKLRDGVHPLIAADRVEKRWKYRDTGKWIELAAGEVAVQVEKATGAVCYLDNAGSVLLAERSQESRLLEQGKSWLFLDWQKKEQLFAMGAEDANGTSGSLNATERTTLKRPTASISGESKGPEALRLRGSARYISHGDGPGKLPFILSDRGYGILPATSGICLCCDIPAYGSYLYMEGAEQQDYYFIAGKQQKNIVNAYAYLCGTLA